MERTWIDARSVFLSDLHIGWRYSRAQWLLDKLSAVRCEYLYLVGDTFEWTESSKDWLDKGTKALRRAIEVLQSRGTSVFLISGNHDYRLIEVNSPLDCPTVPYCNHLSVRKQSFLIIHGDIFDLQYKHKGSSSERVGSYMYSKLLWLGGVLQSRGIMPPRGVNHWATLWKSQFKDARVHMRRFQRFMVKLSEIHRHDGVICGHIHRPAALETVHGLYFNCGDWVEHKSVLVETHTGDFRLTKDATK